MDTGNFYLQENSFYSGGKRFCIKQRKAMNSKHPPLYLIQLQPFRYISSLYPKAGEENTFTFDDRETKTLYILKKNEGEVQVSELE